MRLWRVQINDGITYWIRHASATSALQQAIQELIALGVLHPTPGAVGITVTGVSQ